MIDLSNFVQSDKKLDENVANAADKNLILKK